MAIFIYLFFAPLISLKILTWRRPDISPHVGERIATYGIFAVLNVFISSVVVEIIRNVSKFTIRAFMFQYGVIAIVTAILLPFIAEIFITATKRGNVTLTVTKTDDAEDDEAEQAAADASNETDEVDDAEATNETNKTAASSEEENKEDVQDKDVTAAEATEEPEDLEEQDADKSEEQTNDESDQTEETEKEKEDARPED